MGRLSGDGKKTNETSARPPSFHWKLVFKFQMMVKLIFERNDGILSLFVPQMWNLSKDHSYGILDIVRKRFPYYNYLISVDFYKYNL